MSVYRFYNEGNIPHLAHGWRSVVALPPGRKYIVLVDWTTLETAKVELAAWQRAKPEPVEYRPRVVLAAMKARLRYVTATAIIKQAMAIIKGGQHAR